MQLKFRQPIYNADGTFKEWHYWGFGVGIGDEFVTPHSGYRKSPSQQFTGMQDVKGRDIYCGDYVNIGTNVICEAVWVSEDVAWGFRSKQNGIRFTPKYRILTIVGNTVEGITS